MNENALHSAAMRRDAHDRRLRRAAGMTLLVVTLWGTGCAKPLLSPSEERSQFDRYDAVRNKHAPQYIENEYGRRQPNLRGRLEPRN